mmetsp:Transcript_6133/g.14890  ORF Transcript_6133/g.14890 Transcript_6133/m.14890 type:complete len:103 (+) Transcript_6133:1399-1707(+)
MKDDLFGRQAFSMHPFIGYNTVRKRCTANVCFVHILFFNKLQFFRGVGKFSFTLSTSSSEQEPSRKSSRFWDGIFQNRLGFLPKNLDIFSINLAIFILLRND